IYAALDKLWIGFFIESDPINRQPEGPGSRTLLSLGHGALAGFIGGLVFWPQIVAVDGLHWIARLAGGGSSPPRAVVHLVISTVIGAGFGVLFERESPDWSAALGWGMLYGITWWFVGTLTLFPIGSELPSRGRTLPPLPPSLHFSAISFTAPSPPPFTCFSNTAIRIGCASTRASPHEKRVGNVPSARPLPRSGFSP